MLCDILLLLVLSVIQFRETVGADKECRDLHGRAIDPGLHYVPGPDTCTLCICDNGLPKWCKAVLCTPPQDCKSFRVGSSCCEFICLDDTLPKANDGNDHNEVGLCLIASGVTAALSLSLLFFLVHRLRLRKVRSPENRQLNHDQRSLGSIGYIAGSLGYMGGSMGYLGNSSGVSDYPYEPSPLTSHHYALWKPSGNYFPRGEAPPPYEEAVAAAHAEALAASDSRTASNVRQPVNIATTASFRVDQTQGNEAGFTSVQINSMQHSQPNTASNISVNNINLNMRERSNTIIIVPSTYNHKNYNTTIQSNCSLNRANNQQATSRCIESIPSRQNTAQAVTPKITQKNVQCTAPIINQSTKQLTVPTIPANLSSSSSNSTQSSTLSIVTNTPTKAVTTNPISSIVLSHKKNKSILSHLEQCEACSQHANALENESNVALDLSKTHSTNDLLSVLPPPLFDNDIEVKSNSSSMSRHRTIPRHIAAGTVQEDGNITQKLNPPLHFSSGTKMSSMHQLKSPSHGKSNKLLPLSLPSASKHKTKPLPLTFTNDKDTSNNLNTQTNIQEIINQSTASNNKKTLLSQSLSLSANQIFNYDGTQINSTVFPFNKTKDSHMMKPKDTSNPRNINNYVKKSEANEANNISESTSLLAHGIMENNSTKNPRTLYPSPSLLNNSLSLSIAPLIPTNSTNPSLDDGDDYRSECENCKSAHGSRYYLQEDEELGSPHETMTLQRKMECNEDENYYRTSLTLPTNTKKTRNTPLHVPNSARESWFNSMPSTSSSEDD